MWSSPPANTPRTTCAAETSAGRARTTPRTSAPPSSSKSAARAKGITTAQLALAWLLAQEQDLVPVPGTRGAKRLGENGDAVGVQLTYADLARITETLPHGSACGRYPVEMLFEFITD
ncbi:aldo/keto reductase [Asanoa ferruginea]|uniref:aldo/keto reductase n=1 Tax=Asanoa ferruginea TaxID=53367 RepID=UPI001941691C|nr:aldo/keto reductase [Asanoa ferruginea]